MATTDLLELSSNKVFSIQDVGFTMAGAVVTLLANRLIFREKKNKKICH